MSSNWENFFKKSEQERLLAEEQRRQEAERKRQEAERQRQEAERQRQLAEQRKKASIQRVIKQFDWEIQSLLRGYAAAKMRGTARVEAPEPYSSYPTWRLVCSGYVGVSVSLQLTTTSSGEVEPKGFSISGTDGGRTQAGPSISDLANALAYSIPTVYTPPSCSCDSHGGMSYSVCP